MAAGQVRGGTSSESEGQQIRYRLSFWQLVWPIVLVLVMWCAMLIVKLLEPPTPAAYAPTATERRHILEFNITSGVILGLLLLLAMLRTRSYGITLTPTEARVHGMRRRVIPWSDVRAVNAESTFGTRSVCLYEANRRTQLRAPVTGFLSWDRRFEEKYHTIGQWYLDHLESSGEPPSESSSIS